MQPNFDRSVPVLNTRSGRYGTTVPKHVTIRATSKEIAVMYPGAAMAVRCTWDALEEITEPVWSEPQTNAATKEQYVTLAWRYHPRYYLGCPFCEKQKKQGNDFFPDHVPSSMCQSGSRNHCTCDMCF